MTYATIADALAQHREVRAMKAAPDDKTWVIKLNITEARYMPKTNPLFYKGVRIYFDLSGPIEPL
jgi:hypothetical protein